MTHVWGLELFQIDFAELQRHLRNKCQASVTVNLESLKGKEYSVIVIQGNMIKEIEESLAKRYMVPVKYIESNNRLP